MLLAQGVAQLTDATEDGPGLVVWQAERRDRHQAAHVQAGQRRDRRQRRVEVVGRKPGRAGSRPGRPPAGAGRGGLRRGSTAPRRGGRCRRTGSWPNRSSAWRALLRCSVPIRCQVGSRPSSSRTRSTFSAASWTRFSPTCSMPAATASAISSAGWVLLTPISVTRGRIAAGPGGGVGDLVADAVDAVANAQTSAVSPIAAPKRPAG